MVENKTEIQQPLSVKKNMFFNTVGSVIYQGCLWLITILVVILSNGYGDSGALSFAMTIGNMFFAVATYSMRTYQVSDVDGKYQQSTYVGFRLVTIGIGFATMVPYTLFVVPDFATKATVVLFLLFKTDEEFCDVLYGIDQRYGRMDYIGISQTMRGIALVAGFSAGMVLTADVRVAVVCMFTVCFAITLAYDIPHARRLDSIRPRITRRTAGVLLVKCLPVMLASLLLGTVVAVARQCFGNMFSVEELGIYAAVATPAVLVQVMARYMYSPVIVPLAERWLDDVRGFKKLFFKTLLMLLGVSLAVVIFLSLIGSPLLEFVYGQSIVEYTYLFPFVLMSTVILALAYYVSDCLVVCRDMKGLIVSSVAPLVVMLAIMVPFENMFYMNGINIAIIVSMLVSIIVALAFLWRDWNAKEQ